MHEDSVLLAMLGSSLELHITHTSSTGQQLLLAPQRHPWAPRRRVATTCPTWSTMHTLAGTLPSQEVARSLDIPKAQHSSTARHCSTIRTSPVRYSSSQRAMSSFELLCEPAVGDARVKIVQDDGRAGHARGKQCCCVSAAPGRLFVVCCCVIKGSCIAHCLLKGRPVAGSVWVPQVFSDRVGSRIERRGG